jgi:hypothetical protein
MLSRTVKEARMPVDPALGGLLRELRTTHRLSMATLAKRVGCGESLISLVETGKRPLQPWLAERLDVEYGTGGTLAALLNGGSSTDDQEITKKPSGDVLVIQVTHRGRVATVSRRELLAALGIGALGGPLFQAIHVAHGETEPTPDLIKEYECALDGFQMAARTMSPTKVIDPLIGRAASLDVMRQRAAPELRRGIAVTQTRYAECLGWMHEEANDVHGALYWIDRATHWAQAINWNSMAAYGLVRRSMLALSYLDDSQAAIESAEAVLRTPGTNLRIKGLAAKQLAFSLALKRRSDDSSRALDLAMQYLSQSASRGEGDAAGVGQRSVVNDDLMTIFRATCDIYLGRGESVIPALKPRLDSISAASLRTHTITSAKLVHAYASAGAPDLACSLLSETLSLADTVGSLSAKRELARAAPALTYWDRRPEVRDTLRRLAASL